MLLREVRQRFRARETPDSPRPEQNAAFKLGLQPLRLRRVEPREHRARRLERPVVERPDVDQPQSLRKLAIDSEERRIVRRMGTVDRDPRADKTQQQRPFRRVRRPPFRRMKRERMVRDDAIEAFRDRLVHDGAVNGQTRSDLVDLVRPRAEKQPDVIPVLGKFQRTDRLHEID